MTHLTLVKVPRFHQAVFIHNNVPKTKADQNNENWKN